jgi:hypothetical protein
MGNVPVNKPNLTREKALEYLAKLGVDLAKEKVVLLGLRGYYADSFGAKGKNDIGVYDDAFAWIDEHDFATFNGNTDPSKYRSRMASLLAGRVWRYKTGHHGSKAYGPYPAFRQAAKVTVMRYVDGKQWDKDVGLFGINIHHGSKGTGNGTSSLGCQTIPYAQWKAFKEFGYMLIARHGVKDFAYGLIDVTA